MTKKHDEWWETLTDEEAEEENREYSENMAAMKEVYLKKGREAGLSKAIELMGTDKEPLKPWLTPADCAGIRNIYRAQLREALEAEQEEGK